MRTASRAALLLVACVLSTASPPASALDPALDASQYGHTAFRIREGFAKGSITSLAQTPDGYLWIGTASGLLRFDGIRTVPWPPPGGGSLPDQYVRALLGARDGTLWIGTFRGLASWSDGKLVSHPRFDGVTLNALAEDRDGTIWIGASAPSGGLLCSLRLGSVTCAGEDGGLGKHVGSIYQDGNGVLWAAGIDRVWRWQPGPPKAYLVPEGMNGSLQDLGTANGTMVLLTRGGISRIAGEGIERLPLPALPRPVEPNAVLRDRDGGLWIGLKGGGLLHVHRDRADIFGRADGLSGDRVSRLFEDREGNVWVATNEGLDRFRALAASTYSLGQGLSGGAATVLAPQDGSVWISTARALKRFRDGRMEETDVRGLPEAALASLFEDSRGRVWIGADTGAGHVEDKAFVRVTGMPPGYIDSFAEDRSGSIWMAHREAGLFRWSRDGALEQTPWTDLGGRAARRIAADSVQGGLWLGYFDGGVTHVIDGRLVARYSVDNGLGRGAVNQLSADADGVVWVATEGGLSRIRAGRVATLDSRAGLPCDAVNWTIEADGAWWLYASCALLRVDRAELDAWTAAVDGGKARPLVNVTAFDGSDGVRALWTVGVSFGPQAANARDGTLWFAAADGVTVVDPRRLPSHPLAPAVLVEEVVADRQPYPVSSALRLPPLTRDLEIRYTATSLAVPEKVRFRYLLEGRDRDWQDAGNRRRAFFNDLPPGNYRFRVTAANGTGAWNEQGAALDLAIEAAYWQTSWFRALLAAAFVGLVYALYRVRVAQIARHFNATLDARVSERTRIARDLHDTLLQSFHGLLLRFQTALDLLPGRPADARQVLAGAIDQAAGAITEGRDALQGLRESTLETNDLADSIRAVGEELASAHGDGATLRVEVQGIPRALHPIVRDETFRIAGEALRNVFRHANAGQIEVELRYDERQLRLRVRDDGRGIDPVVLRAEGREGHYGLRGMRERSKLAGGKLAVWSGLDAGTEVEVTIPASHAYAAAPQPRSWLAEKLFGESTTSDS